MEYSYKIDAYNPLTPTVIQKLLEIIGRVRLCPSCSFATALDSDINQTTGSGGHLSMWENRCMHAAVLRAGQPRSAGDAAKLGQFIGQFSWVTGDPIGVKGLIWDYFIISFLFRKRHHISMVSFVSSIWWRNRANERDKYGILETFRGEPCLLEIVTHYLRPGVCSLSMGSYLSRTLMRTDSQGTARGSPAMHPVPGKKSSALEFQDIFPQENWADWYGSMKQKKKSAMACEWAVGMISTHAGLQKWIESHENLKF